MNGPRLFEKRAQIKEWREAHRLHLISLPNPNYPLLSTVASRSNGSHGFHHPPLRRSHRHLPPHPGLHLLLLRRRSRNPSRPPGRAPRPTAPRAPASPRHCRLQRRCGGSRGLRRRGASGEVPAGQPGPAEGVAPAAQAEGTRYRCRPGRELRVRYARAEIALGARRPARVRGRADAALPPYSQATGHCRR